MTWQTSRRRELWSAFLEPTSLLIGLWGVVFDQLSIVCLFIGLRILLGFIRPTGWKATTADVGFFVTYLAVMIQLPPMIKDLSLAANAVLPWLMLSSALHILVYHGHAERLLDKLIESGEFQREHEKLETWLKTQRTQRPRVSGS